MQILLFLFVFDNNDVLEMHLRSMECLKMLASLTFISAIEYSESLNSKSEYGTLKKEVLRP